MNFLTFEKEDIINKKEINSSSNLGKFLSKIHPSKNPYFILNMENKNYIQCAGSKERLVVEIRLFSNHEKNKFKHFVIGKLPLGKTWHKIECKIGPIRVLENEVLKLEDATKLFMLFLKEEEFSKGYIKRNTTKLHK
jgi:hypothetical protein